MGNPYGATGTLVGSALVCPCGLRAAAWTCAGRHPAGQLFWPVPSASGRRVGVYSEPSPRVPLRAPSVQGTHENDQGPQSRCPAVGREVRKNVKCVLRVVKGSGTYRHEGKAFVLHV